MKRKILVTLLAFCLIASLCVVGAAAAATAMPTDDNNDGVITLTQDVNLNSAWTVSSKITLDLAGYTVKATGSNHAINVVSGGNLTIVDSSEAQSGTVDVTADDTAPLVIQSGGVATIEGGKFTRSCENSTNASDHSSNSWYTVDNHGTLYVKGGTITNNSYYSSLIRNLGTMYVTGGLIQQDNFNALKNDGGDGESGKLYVTGGKIKSATQQAIQNWAEAEIGGSAEITGAVYTWASETYDSYGSTEITGGTIIGDVYAVTYDDSVSAEVIITNGNITGTVAASRYGSAKIASVITIESSTINGDVINNGTNGTVISNSTITGDIKGTAEFTVSGSHVSGQVPDSAVVIDSTVAGVPTDSAPDNVVAVIGAKQYKDLEDALEESGDEHVTIELVADANMVASDTNHIVSKRNTVINGNGHTINITADPNDKFDSTRDKMLRFDGATLTLNNVTLNITGQNDGDGTYSGDAIDLIGGAHLYANDSFINIKDVGAGFVIETTGEDIVLTNTDVTVENVNGNGSQGGNWVVNGSNISFTNCGDHGLSVETIKATNSVINVDDADKLALFGSVIDLNSTAVNVTNSGSDLPVTEGYAETLGGYHSPVQVKGIATEYYLNIDAGSSITVTNSHNGNNTVYLPAGAELINNGTINATVNVPADSDMNVVLFMADGRQYDVQVVNDGDYVRMPTLSKSGYTFTGWRVNSSNTIVRGGESYPITANTTFTAVWNMIMIPDTYDIAVDQPAHGTVDVSFSNASQGSVITVTATPDEGYELVYITVDGEPISGNSFVMPDHAVEVSALFAEIGKEVNFVDVSRADWFYDYVQYVAQNGLMEGTTRTAFEPNASMTRAMFWTVLARIDGETITGDAWKTLAQTWAVESGISDGTNADALITREQMVTMLYRYAGSPVTGGMAISEFTDGASVSDYATDAVTWALSEGILTGMGDGILAPQGTATRAQAAAMLMRFVEA